MLIGVLCCCMCRGTQIGDVGTCTRPAPRRPSCLHFSTPPDVHTPLSKSPISSDVLSDSTPGIPSTSSAHCVITGENSCTSTDATYTIASASSPRVSGTLGSPNPSHLCIPPLPLDDIVGNTATCRTTTVLGLDTRSSNVKWDHPTLQTEVALMRCEIMKFYHLKTTRRYLH